ncbi:26S proteasome regulatory subunit T4 [Nematocida ausubeli]|uniref:26S protease regulatory subunit 10B n=1 Tax=Nematocida ausubeli (strain ATCC PRA-371 / ERTm2) TaxID=1913371 RepID=A0A086J4C7_NEMA1|nr:26S protease regulatory subunit 10B [Nematocida ausubeli]KAI5132421.1 26S proteasome regulatory subunit T4 [Nematocida ausubeli]KAI5134781.1 26S proteasome regulatory subunit T4 [Nematocida ausubeli]KAI5147758.1 26S proteasome regulatory subunit T4 [Nematocida ausubeli]KAI5159180.1 26S proteasome regulatory subunit T4 [Nematocida ausubeli]KAI5161958.1 26S proteasome regulatory subunit T4 [Nematocida ausubeli]
MDQNKQDALLKYQKIVTEHAEVMETMRNINESIKNQTLEFEKTERDINALQSIGQMVGEVLKQLDEDRFIVKTSQGPRYIVGARKSIPRNLLVLGARVALDITTLTIMRHLPREVDPTVHAMSIEKPGDISFESIGGLAEQVREIREVIELPIKNPEIFSRVGVSAPKGVLLYGPPGTGKTLLARAVAATLDSNFLKVVSSAIIEKYIGESSRMIREMFTYAKENQPCVIFLDEIDAIGGKRSSESTSSDREVQRTLMELLNQMDGFEELGRVKVIMATNRPDILDPALLRPGRLDRKIEIPLPTSQGRLEILKIHSAKMEKKGDIDYNTIVKMSHGFNGADIRNICSEAGMLAIRDDRDFIVQEDLTRSVRKIADQKKLEGRMDYKKV